MSELSRRPKTIWITQILLIVVGVPFSFVALFGILRYIIALVEVEGASSALLLYLSILLNIVLILVVGFASWGLIRRRNYGRWLSVLFVLLLITFAILGNVNQPDRSFSEDGYENASYGMGRIFGMILMLGLSGLLVYRLVFGESVTDFFIPATEEDQYDPPPPTAYSDELGGTAAKKNSNV